MVLQRPRSVASDDWHLVSGNSEDEGSERSMAMLHGGVCSRPDTPAVSLMGEHSHDVGSECPPTPESERLADTVLSAPMGSAASVSGHAGTSASHSTHASAAVPASSPALASGSAGDRQALHAAHAHGLARAPTPSAEVVGVDGACGSEVVGLHCLQGLSQEGPLEGFASQRPASAALPKSQHDPPGEGAPDAAAAPEGAGERLPATGRHSGTSLSVLAEEDEDELDGLLLLADGWQGLDAALHLAGMDTLMELLEDGLGWTRGYVMEACRAGIQNLHQAVQATQQAVARNASSLADGAAHAREQAQAALAEVLLSAHKLVRARNLAPANDSSSATDGKAPARPASSFALGGGLLLSALGLTTLATLAGLFFFMGRCRHLSAQLQQRDRELARLVVKVLNLQEVLQQPRLVHGPPVLRQTSLLTGLSLAQHSLV